jgi:hypothetical protein
VEDLVSLLNGEYLAGSLENNLAIFKVDYNQMAVLLLYKTEIPS